MIKLRNSEQILDIKVTIPVWRSVVQLLGEELPTEPCDFDVLNDDGIIIDYFEGFNTIYDSGDGYIQFTNDSSVYYNYLVYNENNYVTSIKITTESSCENGILYQSGQGKKYKKFSMDLYNEDGFYLYKIEDGGLVETTIEERKTYYDEKTKNALETNKVTKVIESKELLSRYLELHPLVSDCHGGVEAEYSVTAEKQSLMSSNYLTYTIAKSSGLDVKLTWNASGCECEEWTEEEYMTLILQISGYVKPLVSLQQYYEVIINNCVSQEELDAITIDYSILQT